jgi:hypothetical protein
MEQFFKRLEIYASVTPTTAMTDTMVELMVEVLTILAIATKEVKHGRRSESMSHIFTILDSHLMYIRKVSQDTDGKLRRRG